jgi:hypothetical protein
MPSHLLSCVGNFVNRLGDEIHYAHVLAAIDELDYQGYIGLEYNPGTSSEDSFSWLPANRRSPLDVSKSGEG